MKKSVYSIVLSDEVVEAIDSMAYSMNTSRSNLINQILAEKVSLQTPEKRMRDIFTAIEQLMDSRFQPLPQLSESMMSVKSPLKYKYKPTIRYSVELSRNFDGKVGKLKVQFRTQSAGLIEAIGGFFDKWQRMENRYLESVYPSGVPSKSAEGRYERDFYSPTAEKMTDKMIATAISGYIQLMDRCIQIYFDGLTVGEDRFEKAEATYREYLGKGIAIL
jgi:hypothetical protein